MGNKGVRVEAASSLSPLFFMHFQVNKSGLASPLFEHVLLATTTKGIRLVGGRMKHVTYPSCTHMALNALHGHMNHIYCPIPRICKNTAPSVHHNLGQLSQILSIHILPYKFYTFQNKTWVHFGLESIILFTFATRMAIFM